MILVDRGYTDYEWFMSLTEQSGYFVTRLKENADYGVVEKREIPQRRQIRDEVVFFYKLAQASQEAFSGGSSFTMRNMIACWYF